MHDDDDSNDNRAFVAVKIGDHSWVTDLPKSELSLGRGPDCGMRLDAPDIQEEHCRLDWDGERVALKLDGSSGPTFLNGKRIDSSAELKPGDEIAFGSVQLVLGIAVPPYAGGRRALTHHEFRERLYEEMARAARGGRPTVLVMVHARAGEGGRVATAALDQFRAGDVVGTFAHDEIEFLLPDTPKETAQVVVDRVLSASGAQRTSAGLAVAPEHGDNPERLLRAARAALAVARTTGRIEEPPAREPSRALPEVEDPASRELVTALEGLADSADSVLITGELSSGKSLFARILHDKSPRKDGPFVVVPCGALDEDELQALFSGDSSPDKRATGGTLLLDEVGDLSEQAQHIIRTTLEGAPNVRPVSTTHRMLAGLVERGAFDKELYRRLAAHVIELPPLRNRPEDIIPLAERFALQSGAPDPVRMSAGALARLRSYPWPGNVLELMNAMERAVRLAHGGEILAEHLPSDVLPMAAGEGRLREHVDSVERDAIIKALADANHNQTHAAKRLGVSRRALIYKMEKYGLKPPPGAGRKG